MLHSNNQETLSIAQTVYDNLSPFHYKEDKETPVLLDNQEKTLEIAYEYIEQQELTNKDIELLDKALLSLPEFLENVKKWHEKREEKKLKKYPHLINSNITL